MIVPSDDELRRKEEAIPDATVRYPPQAARRRGHYHPNTLPDYETSQALAAAHDGDEESVIVKPAARLSRFDTRFWKTLRYTVFAYTFLTLVVGVPVVVYFKNQASSSRPANAAQHFASPPPTFYGYSNNFANVLLGDQSAECEKWDSVTRSSDGDDNTTLFHGLSVRNVSATSDFFFNSNASLWLSTLEGNSGSFTVQMNPDHSVKSALLSWELQTTDPYGANSVCFSKLSSNGTMLDVRLPAKSSYVYRYLITLQLPYSKDAYTIPLFSVSFPYFDIKFDDLDSGPIFGSVNVQGSGSGPTTFTSLHARDVVVNLGVGEILGTFDVTNSLSLNTMDSAIKATARVYSNGPTSSIMMSSGSAPLDATLTLDSNSGTEPSFWISLKTTNEPLDAQVIYDRSLDTALVRLDATTQLAPAMVTLDSKFQGTFALGSYLAPAYLLDKRAGDPLKQGRNRGLVLDTNTTDRSAGWIGWGSRPESGAAQGAIVVNSIRDKAGCIVR